MNREQLLREIDDLSRIPGFERILYHKVKELKENVSRNPGYYFEILERQDREREASPVEEVEFELHLFGKSTWVPLLSDSDLGAYEWITDEVVDYILGIEATPGMPHMRSNIPIEEGRKTVDLTFTKHGMDFYSGTAVYRRTGAGASDPGPAGEGPGGPRDDGDKIRDLKQMVQYLWRNEIFLDRMVSEFRLRWKPLIDSEVIPTAK